MFKKKSLLFKLLVGIILGIIIGLASQKLESYIVVRTLSTISLLFGNFLNYSIPLIIIGFVTIGIADMGKSSSKLLSLTLILAYLSTIIAGFFAFLIGLKLLPSLLQGTVNIQSSNTNLDPLFSITITPLMDVMAALVTAFVFGIGIAYTKKGTLYELSIDFKSIVEIIVGKVLVPFVPIYICGIFAKLSASGDIFHTLKSFSSVYILILPLQGLVIFLQYALACTLTKQNPIKAIKNMVPSYMMAVGTQSSAAAIPLNLSCAKKNGVAEEVADFTIPLCATIHLAGDTITLVLGAMSIMILNGQVPTAELIIPYIFMLGVTMVAAPGIPGGGAYAALGLLKDMLGFNPAQQGLMVALHFAQDSFGTATNVCGDGAIALIVNKLFTKETQSSMTLNPGIVKEA